MTNFDQVQVSNQSERPEGGFVAPETPEELERLAAGVSERIDDEVGEFIGESDSQIEAGMASLGGTEADISAAKDVVSGVRGEIQALSDQTKSEVERLADLKDGQTAEAVEADAGKFLGAVDGLIKLAAGQENPDDAAAIQEKLLADTSEFISQVPEDQVSAFVAEMNKRFPGAFKGGELRLVSSASESLIMVGKDGSLQERVVNKDTAESALSDVKEADLELRGRSYELRREILKRSEGSISTEAAYTYSLDIPKGGDLDAYLDDPANWVPERLALHEQIISSEYEKALEISKRMEDSEPTIYALRGNTASGKSTSVKNSELFNKALDDKGQPTGAINPDTYKVVLMESDSVDGKKTVAHKQTHEESSMLARKISEKIAKTDSSMVIDKRMDREVNIDRLMRTAETNGKAVKIMDIDVPLETSLIIVLGREPGGDAPLVPFEAIAEGFEGVRKNRQALIDRVRSDPKIKDYVLKVADESGVSREVAVKKDGEFYIIEGMGPLYEKALSDNVDEVGRLGATVIDGAYIERIVSGTPEKFRAKTKSSLEAYRGSTLKEALQKHSDTLNPE